MRALAFLLFPTECSEIRAFNTLVSRFRNSFDRAASSFANFGIEGH